jgi:hypothetical protein
MRKFSLVILVILAAAAVASAQITSPTRDVLGAHNVYGRGCLACHAPHSGAAGNGLSSSPNSGNEALWGTNMTPLYGQTLMFGGGSFWVDIPNYGTTPITVGSSTFNPTAPNAHDGTWVIAACLSCHDGNVATDGMMRGTAYETVTISGAQFNPPTLLGNDGSTAGNYLNDHPVGPSATVSCGGKYDWDCTVNSDGSISYSGSASSQFLSDYYDVTKYGPIHSLVKVPGTQTGTDSNGNPVYSSNSWVTCTTCHDQHDMSYFNAGPTVGNKPTHFFVRGWYDPGNSLTSNSAAQFCRTCHGGESNEMHGQTVATQ